MALTQLRGLQISDNSITADDVVYSLDDAYDNGGAGLGKDIIVDSGPITLDAASATAMIVSGTLELYGPSATGPALKIVRGDIERQATARICRFIMMVQTQLLSIIQVTCSSIHP